MNHLPDDNMPANHEPANHIANERIVEHLFDAQPLDATEQAHLAHCGQCTQSLQHFSQLGRELAITRMSKVTKESLAAYYQLFGQVQTTPNIFTRSLQWVKAQLQWDSRQEPALQGVRGAGSPTYRLLYSSDVVDVELFVEARNGSRWIEGEIIPLDSSALHFPALLQLSRHGDEKSIYEVESDLNGRFRIDSLNPGSYALSMLPREGLQVQIETVGLT